MKSWTSPCGRATLFLGDCRDVLLEHLLPDPNFPTSRFSMITDPPFGIRMEAGNSKHGRAARAGESFQDDPEWFRREIVPRLEEWLSVVDRSLVFCAGAGTEPGKSPIWDMPRASALGAVWIPAGCGRHLWGYNHLAPYLLYGRSPDLADGARPCAFASTTRSEPSIHPCPKPVAWAVRCVEIASRPGETVIDPFMGSGAFGVGTAIAGGRAYVGVEIHEPFWEEAVEKVGAAYAQGRLHEHEPMPTQPALPGLEVPDA